MVEAASFSGPGYRTLESPSTDRRETHWVQQALSNPRLRLVGPLAILLTWAALSHFGVLPRSMISSPERVLQTFLRMLVDGRLYNNVVTSLGRAAAGLAIGVTIGWILAVISANWKIGEIFLDSPIRMLQAIPGPAMLPFFVLWFGIDEKPKILFVAFICAFPIYLNTYAGIRSIDARFAELAKVFKFGRGEFIREVVLRGSLPSTLVGLRFSLLYSVMALVLAENIAATEGIGYMLAEAQQYLKTDEMMVAILLYAAIGIAADFLMRVLERVLLPWRRAFSGV